jgi:hypothetical protein
MSHAPGRESRCALRDLIWQLREPGHEAAMASPAQPR